MANEIKETSSPTKTTDLIKIRKAEDQIQISANTERFRNMTPEEIAMEFQIEKRKTERIQKWGGVDAKTGLLRSKQFKDRAQRDIRAAARDPHRSVTFCIADFDDFKQYNNKGTNVGDAVLIKVGEKIRSVIRAGDIASRWGGDELAFIMPSLLPHEKPQTINPAERLRKTCENVEVEIEGQKYFDKIPMTFGIVKYKPGDTFESMFKRASLALRIAKILGKQRTLRATLTRDGKTILTDLTNKKVYVYEKQNGLETLVNLVDKERFKIEEGGKGEKPHLIKLD